MDKAIAICLTALLLLSGCLDASDDQEMISIVGCGDENSLTYLENATESNDELCASEELLESGIFTFIELMEDGPDLTEVNSTMGYTMEVSTENWSYMETVVVNPTGYKGTSQNNYEDYTTVEEMIISGNQIQYTMIEDGETMQVRMKHAGTYEDVIDALMNGGDDDESLFICDNGEEIPLSWVNDGEEDCDDGSDEGVVFNDNSDDTEGRQIDSNNGDDDGVEMVCYDMGSHNIVHNSSGEYFTQVECEEMGFMWTEMPEDNSDHSDDDGMNMGDDDEDPSSSDYTVYFTPNATFTGFDRTESGMTFTGLLNIEGAPFGHLEVYTTEDFTVTGFALMDVESTSNWVKFMLINSGSTIIDETLPLDALPFMLIQMDTSDDSDDSDESDDGEEMFRCDNGEEIQFSWVNDGEEDCDDGSDEGVVFNDNSDDGSDDDHDGNEEGDDEIAMYRCVNFVDETAVDSTTNFSSVFNNSNLDYSLCDTSAEDVNYTFDNSTFTLPTHMMYESCWEEEPNVTMCNYGTIEAVNGSELYETFTMGDDESADDCEGEYNNESNMCTVWTGNITDSDANGFTISDSDGGSEMIVFYQYDSQLSSGILIVVNDEDEDEDEVVEGCTDSMAINFDSSATDDDGSCEYDGDGDGDWSFDRELQDCDSDNDTMVSYDELETCIDEDLANDGYGQMSASDVHAYDEFNMSDMNNDSMLNESEFDYLNSMLSHQNEDPNYQEMFSMMDSDEDGEVTFSEWEHMKNQSDEPMPQDELDRFALIINFFDEDNSGGLAFSEFENMMYTLDSEDDGMDEDPEFMFAMMDSDMDGEVTLSEWVALSNNSDEEPMTQEDIDGLSNMMDMFDEDDSMGLNYSEFTTLFDAMGEDGEGGEDMFSDSVMFYIFGMQGLEGDLDDYSLVLAQCTQEMDSMTGMMMSSDCGEDAYSVKLSSILIESEADMMFSGNALMFMDVDESGTLTMGDMIVIDASSDEISGEWNGARLHSEEADSYSDENPMMPGFTGILATIGLLGAALIRRE